MSKFKHTAGQWIDGNTSDSIIVKTSDSTIDPDGFYGGEVICESVKQCNKPLIKAAPEMLIELLKSISKLDKMGIASIQAETLVMKATGWSYDTLNDILTKLSNGLSIEEVLK